MVRLYCSLKRGVTVKELCLRFRQVAASAAVRVLALDSRYSSSKYSDQSLSSSAQSRTSSNPTTPVKIHTQSLSTRTSLSKRHMSEFQSVLTVIDERKLILFGLLHGLIRRIEKYPMLVRKEKDGTQQNIVNYSNLNSLSFLQQYSPHQSQLYSTVNAGGTNVPEPVEAVSDKPMTRKTPSLYSLFDGSHSFDKICLSHGLSQSELDEIIDRDPEIVTIWK